MKTSTPGSYLLQNIDPALWARFKARSEADGVPMRTLILEFVARYADGAYAVEQQRTTLRPVPVPVPAPRKRGAR